MAGASMMDGPQGLFLLDLWEAKCALITLTVEIHSCFLQGNR